MSWRVASGADDTPWPLAHGQTARAPAPGGPLPLHPTSVGVVRFIAGDELQQHGASLVVHPSGALDGGDDLAWLVDPFRVSAQGAAQLGIVRAGDPAEGGVGVGQPRLR